MKKFIQIIIQWTWGLPQNLIGLILFMIYSRKGNRSTYGHAVVTKWNIKHGSVSLGMFLFVTNDNDINLIKHEYGHSLQSLIFGFLFLIIIGLPSIIWAGCFGNYRIKNDVSYYSLYTESLADKLGGVNRYENL